MPARSYFMIMAGLLLPFCLLGADAPDAPPAKNSGYGRALTEPGRDIVLLQILPRDKEGHEYAVDAKVFTDIRGKIPEGTIIRIYGATGGGFTGSWMHNLPTMDEGAIELWPIKDRGAGKYEYLDDQGRFPIGLTPDTRIATSDMDKVKAALKELRAAVDATGHDGPSRQRAGELLKEKNYYLWALGVWRIARDTNAKDVKLLKDLIASDSSLAQVMWLDETLTTGVTAEDLSIAPSQAELQGLLRSYLRAYVRRQPGPPGSVAPATAPAPGQGVPQTQEAPH